MIGERGLTRRAFLGDLARVGGAAAGLGLLAGCTPAPQPASGPRVYRVGVLTPPTPILLEALDLFWTRMVELGYVEGENLIRIQRTTDQEAADFAAELARLPVDLIVATTDFTVRAAVSATTSIPIVATGFADPVEAGVVGSLARPGGNVTGVLGAPPEVQLKRLQLLVEAVPTISKVAVLLGLPPLPETTWESAASALGIGFVGLKLASRDAIEPSLDRAIAEGADALLGQSSLVFAFNTDVVDSFLARHRLPSMYPGRSGVERGGLMTYEARFSAMYRRAAEFVDRILRGARPADLPIELPTHYDLIVNMRTARALGLTFPPAFLAQVDEVIE